MNTQTSPALRGQKRGVPDEATFDRQFRPRGAFAFFILLLILAVATWYGIYLLMLSRS